jgi:hypothetical protein
VTCCGTTFKAHLGNTSPGFGRRDTSQQPSLGFCDGRALVVICLLMTASLPSHTTIAFTILRTPTPCDNRVVPRCSPAPSSSHDAPQHSLSADAHVTSRIFPTGLLWRSTELRLDLRAARVPLTISRYRNERVPHVEASTECISSYPQDVCGLCGEPSAAAGQRAGT